MARPGVPELFDADAAVFPISVAAQLAGMHPQTLRTYDRMNLVSPQRTGGRGRRYSRRDIARLRLIQRLSQEEGINLSGVQRILALMTELDEAQRRIDELTGLLAELSARHGSRIFTVGAAGDVAQGRRKARPIAALTSRVN